MISNNSHDPEKLLVSACLLGQPVRYDGKSKGLTDIDWLQELERQQRLVVLCPEVAGGLAIPRPAAEINGELVIASTGDDVTAAFRLGALEALALCKLHKIKYALLKAKSPSCGNQQIYDGTFSGQLTSGMGLTARLLSENGIRVFSELQLDELQREFKVQN